MLPRRVAIPLGVVIGILVLVGPATNAVRHRLGSRELARFAPTLEADFRRHVEYDSEQAWVRYCRAVGTGSLGDALQTLGQAMRNPDLASFPRRRRAIEPAMLRVAAGLLRAFDFPAAEERLRHEHTLSDSADYELHRLECRYIAINTDTVLPAAERIRVVNDLARRFEAAGDPYRALYASMLITRFELERGRPDLRRARLEALVEAARRCREWYVLCQLLGELGDLHGGEGREDSMSRCYDEGLAIALRHGFIDHAARLLRFYAGHYAWRGRLALALDRYAEARRLCAQPGGEGAQVRMQLEYTRFLASLGCWDLVARGLRGVPPLLRAMPPVGRTPEVRKYEFDFARLQARLDFAEGRVDEGERGMRGLSVSMPPSHRVAGFVELFEDWSAGLESGGRVDAALGICDRGIAHCDSLRLPGLSSGLRIRKARLLDRLGQVDSAARVLQRAHDDLLRNADADRRDVLSAEILAARLELQLGHARRAQHEIEALFRRFRQQLDGEAGASLSGLDLDDSESLRAAIHEIEHFDPVEGYTFELEWRSLARELGGDRRVGRRERHGPGWPDTRRIAPVRGAVHLVYRFDGPRLLRWSASSRGVTLDTLDLDADRCLAEVRDALEWLQREPPPPGAVLGPGSLAALRHLGGVLLPPGLGDRGAAPLRLDLSPDGPLSALPFEALLLPGRHGDAPLARWADVAYVRGAEPAGRARAGRAVVVSNPTHSAELDRRYGWAPSLAGGEAEARAALARWPGAVRLAGDRVTKDEIRRTWPGASILYLAAHHVREPDAPFLGFVPLAAPAGAPPDVALLEIADVHALDLSACRLAVLASCSSGAPYRSAVRPGPSLADAFLDSGARAVVCSFWDVGDAETRDFMRAFLATWREDGDDAAALARARRAVMATPGGASPRVWAAWTVMTAGR